MTPSSILSRPLGAAMLALLLGGAPALAQETQKPAGRLTPTQQQKLFPELRQIGLQGTQARISILQKQQQCLTAATSAQAMRACQRQERQALMSQREQQRQAVQQVYARNGIAMPQPRSGGNRRLQQQGDDMPTL